MRYQILFVIFFVFGFILPSQAAQTAPFYDSKVRAFIESSRIENAEDTLPVIVMFKGEPSSVKNKTTTQINQKYRQYTEEQMQTVRQKFLWAKNLKMESLWVINGFLVSVTANELKSLMATANIQSIVWARRPIFMKKNSIHQSEMAPNYTYGLTKINVPELRLRHPELLGTGVRVGILDTGISPQHPDLNGRLKLFQNFSPATDSSPRDDFGHGTHVAGTVSGGQTSGISIGVAPQAELIIGRIFDGNGQSDNAQIIKAMQWVADPDGDPSTNDFAQVVNNSWSDDEPFADRNPEDEPFCKAVQVWVELGIVPVFSVGNTGPRAGTINIPAGCPQAFSVGATEQNDRSPHFSSTGPAVWRDHKLSKPEVSAPGFKIYSAHHMNRYETMSGTSMAAPHVTGAFAILLQAHPQATAEQLMSIMAQGAKELGEPGQDAIFGWGRIDLIKSLEIYK